MSELTKKQLRIVNNALEGFFSIKALKPARSLDDFKVSNVLARELCLSNNRVVLMTDIGLVHLRTAVATINDADICDGYADYSDIHSASVKVLKEMLSRGEQPDNAIEFVALVRSALATAIDKRTFAVPVFGIKLVEIGVITLGQFRIVPATPGALAEAGADRIDDHVAKAIDQASMKYWLIGSARGTNRVAEQSFRLQAELLMGLLAICAASMFERGAEAFRIGIIMSPEQANGQAAWFSWSEEKRALAMHRKFRAAQDLEVGVDLAKQIGESEVIEVACRFFQADTRTPLEEAILKAVYWYSEAHRELVPVMKLVKYWSAVETFFSINEKDITRSVSAGLASVLVYGGFGFIPPDEYKATRKRISDLYGSRSRAVHRASYNHVTGTDTALLSQWVAWMLINMVSFQIRGYTTVEEIKKHADRIDARMTHVADRDVPT